MTGFNTPVDENNDQEFNAEVTRKIESEEEAIRFAAKLSQTRDRINRINENAEKEASYWKEKLQAIENWREEQVAKEKQKEEYYETMLRQFHIDSYNAASEAEKKRLKSIKLPYGVTLKSTAQQPKYEIKDDSRYLEYAEKNGLVSPPKPQWGEVKKRLQVTETGTPIDKTTGEVVDFISVEMQDRKFEVK